MLHGEKRAPTALVELVADAEIEDCRLFAAGPFDHQPEQQFTGAEFRNGFIDRTELADDVILLARKAGDRGDDALAFAMQANGMQFQQTVRARLGKIGQIVEEIPHRLIPKHIRNALRGETGGLLAEKRLQQFALFLWRPCDHMAVTAHFLCPSALDAEFLPSPLGIDLPERGFEAFEQGKLEGRILVFDGSKMREGIGPVAPRQRYVLQSQNIRPAMQQLARLAGNRCCDFLSGLFGKGGVEKPRIDIVETAAGKTRLADAAFQYDFERQQKDRLAALTAAKRQERAVLRLRPDGAPAETLMQRIERVVFQSLPVGADGGGVIDQIDQQTIRTPPLVLHGGRRLLVADKDRPLSRHPLSPVVSVGLYR